MFDGIYELPIEMLAALTAILFVGSYWIGCVILRPVLRMFVRSKGGENGIVGTVLSAFGVLYGLLLSLIAVAAYQNLSQVDAEASGEAAGLLALYRDVSEFPAPQNEQLRGQLRDYCQYIIDEEWPVQRKGIVPLGAASKIMPIRKGLLDFEPNTGRDKLLQAEAIKHFDLLTDHGRKRRYTGVMPKTAATMAEVLKNYGYKTSAFGKWHNTPADQTTAMGPFNYWPTGFGFEYFYGFLAGETSQWEPRLVENTTAIEPPHDEKYHLTEDMADRGITWLKKHRVFSPDKPFLMYWAPGGVHGPHHVTATWADKYKGKFDQGWDKLREEVFARQKALGWIPASAELTPRDPSMTAWADIPVAERAFQLRLMELYAGFCEHTDAQVGKLVDFLDESGQRDNTIILYLWGDNGSSAEGQNGSISELLAQNQIPNTIAQQINALDGLGGLQALGGPLTDNIYHASWAWAGSTPFRSTKLVAAHFGGTRNPLVVSWPKRIKADKTPRSQFYHVNDIVPTLYDVIGTKAPQEVNGFPQDPIDGVSMAASFTDRQSPENKHVQYFDNNGSDGIYKDGWYACTFGPLSPWLNAQPGLDRWDSSQAVWELYDLTKDFSQMHDLAQEHPEKVEEMKKLFLAQAEENKVFPIGAGIWLRIHPEDRIKSPYTSWTFDDTTTRLPEFTAPALGNHNNTVAIDLECGAEASGVLYALGGAGGGLTCYMDQGHLIFEYNLMIIDRSIAKSAEKIAPGKHTIVVNTTLQAPKPGAPADIVLTVDGKEVARTTAKMTVPTAFTASESFDVGTDLGSTVSRDYFERRPFKFDGKIARVNVELK